jgi:hypothetical protein
VSHCQAAYTPQARAFLIVLGWSAIRLLMNIDVWQHLCCVRQFGLSLYAMMLSYRLVKIHVAANLIVQSSICA